MNIWHPFPRLRKREESAVTFAGPVPSYGKTRQTPRTNRTD